jgi:hypothetical protein
LSAAYSADPSEKPGFRPFLREAWRNFFWAKQRPQKGAKLLAFNEKIGLVEGVLVVVVGDY